jgi:hypothetical protein
MAVPASRPRPAAIQSVEPKCGPQTSNVGATPLSNGLIYRIRESSAGFFIQIRLPDDGRQLQQLSPQILYLFT